MSRSSLDRILESARRLLDDDGTMDGQQRREQAKIIERSAQRLQSAQHSRDESEQHKRILYSLFLQAPTFISVLRGPEHIIELANPPLCEFWGVSEDEIRNQPLASVRPEFRDQRYLDIMDDVYRTGVPYVGKETLARFRGADGSIEHRYFNFVFSPFRNLDGEVEAIFSIASDVTAQVVARDEVNSLREVAESANRAKDEFLAMLGHELRNPLSPILTALQIIKLQGGEVAERARTVIERQVTHLTRLVDDLLDVSRIARGKVELKTEVVETAEIVAKAIELASPLLEERRHILSVDVPRRGLAIEGDAMRLSQVVSNLLTNAAKYTPQGGRVIVRAERVDDDVVLRVRDTGIGIAADVLPRVFDLFVQEQQAIDRSRGGLGLGLTIVRNLVERHGGSVSAHSEGTGHGSEFIVRLPIAVHASGDVGDATLAKAMLDELPRAIGPRILIVDDNEDGAAMLAEVLAQKGYDTRVAHDAPGALRVAIEFVPEVAFLDLGLPVMDGYELAAHLRNLPGLAGVRLIAVTGYGQDSDRRKTREAGFHDHLVKPVALDAIDAALQAAM